MMIASASGLYLTPYLAVAVRQSLVELASAKSIEIIEGRDFAAVLDGPIDDTAPVSRFRVQSSLGPCSIYCDAIKSLTNDFTYHQRDLLRSCPWASSEPPP